MSERLEILFSPEEIKKLVQRLANEIKADHPAGGFVLVGVLKGAFMFLGDLAKACEGPLEVDFMQTSSYGTSDSPADEVRVIKDLTADVKGRDVIIVEGIIDRGHTARKVVAHLKSKGPSSVRICTLLLRNSHSGGLKIDYVGARIDEGFVVGYGMDYKENYRGLPGIYFMK